MSETSNIEIPDRDYLTSWFSAGSTTNLRIGAEHEKLLYHRGDLTPPNYESIRELLEDLLKDLQKFTQESTQESTQELTTCEMQTEDGLPIGISLPSLHNAISLEPAGQLEFAGAPLQSVHDICKELKDHLSVLRPLLERHALGMCAIGARAREKEDELPWMPKKRYHIMRSYMHNQGKLGVSMMGRTATVQANIDFTDESDMVSKMRIATALQPIVTALFAHSPYSEGKANGYLSNRARYWLDTDPQRCGLPLFVFAEDFGFSSWRDYALHIPIYCIVRDGEYIDTSRYSFADYLDGTQGEELREAHGRARLEDWESHLRMIFPEARLKRVIEMRGADSGDSAMLCALPALWSGLLYDAQAQEQSLRLASELASETREDETLLAAHRLVPRLGLRARCAGRTVNEIAKDMLAIARLGLKHRCEQLAITDETQFLEPLEQIVSEQRTHAERLLAIFPQPQSLQDWQKLYDHCAY